LPVSRNSGQPHNVITPLLHAVLNIYNVPGIHQPYFLMFQEFVNHIFLMFQEFINHFYKNVLKLIDRAMRKEDNSPQEKQMSTKAEVTISKQECKN
jgi:hypothetical protein